MYIEQVVIVYKVHEALQTKIEYLVENFSYDYRVNHARK